MSKTTCRRELSHVTADFIRERNELLCVQSQRFQFCFLSRAQSPDRETNASCRSIERFTVKRDMHRLKLQLQSHQSQKQNIEIISKSVIVLHTYFKVHTGNFEGLCMAHSTSLQLPPYNLCSQVCRCHKQVVP